MNDSWPPETLPFPRISCVLAEKQKFDMGRGKAYVWKVSKKFTFLVVFQPRARGL